MSDKALRTLLVIVIVLLPLLELFVPLWVAHHASLTDYTPVFSDEILYWHQARSFQEVGFNSGYYTYAERRAPLGQYYSWGVFIPMFQGALAQFFGGTLYFIPLASAILLSGSLAIFIRVTKLDTERLLWLLAAMITFSPLLLYSAASFFEVTQYALATLIAAAFYSIMTTQAPTRKQGVAAVLLVLLATLLRPTTGMFLLPLCLLVQRRRSGLLIGVALWVAAWVAVWLTSSPYPNPLSQVIQALRSEPLQAPAILIANLLYNFTTFGRGSILEIALRMSVVALLGIFIGNTVLKRVGRKFNLGLLQVEANLYFYQLGLIFLVVTVLYNVWDRRDFRVFAMHLFLMLFLLVAYRRRVWLAGFIVVGFVLLPEAWSAYIGWSGERVQAQVQASYAELRDQLADALVYQPDAPSPWCNTLLHTLYYFNVPDATSTLLAVPSGIGLSHFQNVDELTFPLKSRYLLFADDFYIQHADQLRVEPLLAVPGGNLYLNLDSACLNRTDSG